MEAGLESTLQFKLTVPPSIVDTSLWSNDTSGASEDEYVSVHICQLLWSLAKILRLNI